MICCGIGLDEDAVIKYFAAAKNQSIWGVRLKNIRDYLDDCCFPAGSFYAQKYHIQDPFIRAVVIPNTVMFHIEYEEKAVLGEIVEVEPIPRRFVDEILEITPVCRNTAYSNIIGLYHPELSGYSATIGYLIETGIL